MQTAGCQDGYRAVRSSFYLCLYENKEPPVQWLKDSGSPQGFTRLFLAVKLWWWVPFLWEVLSTFLLLPDNKLRALTYSQSYPLKLFWCTFWLTGKGQKNHRTLLLKSSLPCYRYVHGVIFYAIYHTTLNAFSRLSCHGSSCACSNRDDGKHDGTVGASHGTEHRRDGRNGNAQWIYWYYTNWCDGTSSKCRRTSRWNGGTDGDATK